MNRPATRIQKKSQAIILDAGLDVFSKFGFRGSTLDQVAAAAGMSKPNLLYYFESKEAIHASLLSNLLGTWLDPLRALDADGDPIEELLAYAKRKLEMSQNFPRESRLFAIEIIQGAPRIGKVLEEDLRDLVLEVSAIINGWAAAKKIRPVDPCHLIFSIWALTQHYADFEVQVQAILKDADPYEGAAAHIEAMLRALLTP